MAEEQNQIVATAEPPVNTEAELIGVETPNVETNTESREGKEVEVKTEPKAFGWDEVDDDGNTVVQEIEAIEKAETPKEVAKSTIEYVGLAPIVNELGETERKALQYALQNGKTLSEIVGKIQEFATNAQPIDISTIDVTEYGSSQIRAIIAEEMRLKFPEMSQEELELEIDDEASAFEDLSTNGKKKKYLETVANHINQIRAERYKDLDGNILGTISTAITEQQPIEIPNLTREDVAEYLPEIVVERLEIKDGTKTLLKMPESSVIDIQKDVTAAYEQDLAANTHYVNGKWEVDSAFNKEERIAAWKRLYLGLYLYDNNEALIGQIIKKTKDEALRSSGIGKIQRIEPVAINTIGADSLFGRTT